MHKNGEIDGLTYVINDLYGKFEKSQFKDKCIRSQINLNKKKLRTLIRRGLQT